MHQPSLVYLPLGKNLISPEKLRLLLKQGLKELSPFSVYIGCWFLCDTSWVHFLTDFLHRLHKTPNSCTVSLYLEATLFISHIFMISCWLHCRKMTLHVEANRRMDGALGHKQYSSFGTFSPDLALQQQHTNAFSFLLLPLSFWDITWYSSQGASVYFWHTAHHGIAVFLTASSIPQSTAQNWERYRRENESLKELAMNRGNKTHWWIESKVQNAGKAFGCRGAGGTSHLLVPKAASGGGSCE